VLLACAMIVQPVNAGIAPVGRAASSDGADGSAPLVWAAEPAEGPSLFSPARGSAVVYIPPASDAQPAALVITPAKSVDASTPSGEVERSEVAPAAADSDHGVILVPLPSAGHTGLAGLLALAAVTWIRRLRRVR